MRYFYEPPTVYSVANNYIYSCNHPVYNQCTLITLVGPKGLAVIQQRFRQEDKSTYWGPIDPWIVDDIIMSPEFKVIFSQYARICNKDGLYPTLSVRQLMYKVGLKPLRKERWETVFDHADI